MNSNYVVVQPNLQTAIEQSQKDEDDRMLQIALEDSERISAIVEINEKKEDAKTMQRIKLKFGDRIGRIADEEFEKNWPFRHNSKKVTELVFEPVVDGRGYDGKKGFRGYQLRSTIKIDWPPRVSGNLLKPSGYLFLIHRCAGNSHGWQLNWSSVSNGLLTERYSVMLGRPSRHPSKSELHGQGSWIWRQDEAPYGFPVGESSDEASTNIEWWHENGMVGRTRVECTTFTI